MSPSPAERLNISRVVADYHNSIRARAVGRHIFVDRHNHDVGVLKRDALWKALAKGHLVYVVQERDVTPAEVMDSLWPQTLAEIRRFGRVPGLGELRSEQRP